ncbi:MAG: DNA polymerase III subunit delta [Bacteroidales bacterium]|nr:DNA polymerase III subunit delta [Bacteroidales bacterium]
MKFEQIISDLKNKIFYPVYFLHGEEAFYIDEISSIIEKSVLSDTEKEFNQTILYGRDVDISTVISNAKRFPMMANYQVVIVKEAQDIKDLVVKADKNSNTKESGLQLYLKNPLKSTLLVFCYKYKKLDKRTSLAKTIGEKGVLFESKKIFENQVPSWIENQIKIRGYSITPKATILLSEFLGTNLGKISNEINKLTINLPENTRINETHIEDNIGISKDFNVFELQKALANRDAVKSVSIVNYFAANAKDNPIIKVIAILYPYFIKVLMYHYISDRSQRNVASVLSVHPFFVSDYITAARNYNLAKLNKVISVLREYDLKAKGVDSNTFDDGELMKEMVFKITH